MPQIIVLDTHAWLWYVNRNVEKYPAHWDELIASVDQVGVSAVSCFEIALASKRGRIVLKCPIDEWFSGALKQADVELFPLTPMIAMQAVNLAPVHRDPFDRIIIATALEYGAKLATVDGLFVDYPELTGRLL
ncbi:MAG TPA: PIN domain nuclease [Gammaproteobacteria bacterium]|nr:PIN domain nuclease [Gammaproteobacteria bacterium]